jgi:hypothetical protein
MPTLANSLLDFILNLLRDQEAATAFNDDPQRALVDAGLGDTCGSDVQALLPMLADYAPTGGGAPHNAALHKPHQNNVDSPALPEGSNRSDDHSVAAEHIAYISHNYTYDSTTTIDASHSIWGDSYKIWGDENVVASHGSIAAGDDVEHSFVDNSVEDSYNHTSVEGNGNATGHGNQVDDSFNPENSGNSLHGTGNVVGEENDVDTENSGNDVHGDGNAVGEDNTAGVFDVHVDGDGNALGEDNTAGALDVHVDDVVIAENAAVDSENTVQDSEYVAQDSDVDTDHAIVVTEPHIDLGLSTPLEPADVS